MKDLVVRFLKWALSKFDDKPAQIEAWPFPVGEAPTLKKVLRDEPFSEEPKPKRKPRVAKATTRTVKKPAVVAKTVRTKKAK